MRRLDNVRNSLEWDESSDERHEKALPLLFLQSGVEETSVSTDEDTPEFRLWHPDGLAIILSVLVRIHKDDICERRCDLVESIEILRPPASFPCIISIHNGGVVLRHEGVQDHGLPCHLCQSLCQWDVRMPTGAHHNYVGVSSAEKILDSQ